jgi:hypothetical protein
MKSLPLFFLYALPLLADPVKVPADIDHTAFDTLLQKYVDKQGLVDYAAWKKSKPDMAALDTYLAQFASGSQASGNEEIASLINAYNAFTLDFILDHYPTPSIRKLDDPFDGKRYLIGGRKVSADEIEHDTLRPLIGWKVHALVVCAARSCPPLYTQAFTAETWEDTMADRYKTWLARPDLNTYRPQKDRVELSKIFDWYEKDFTGPNTVKDILTRYGPPAQQTFLSSKDYKIKYLDYHWGLNDQSDLGKDYKHSIFSIF